MTNLSSLEVAGVPTMGVNGLPCPFTGNYFFVNPHTGADGNLGSADQPLQSLAAAYAKCVAGNNDVVFLVSVDNVAADTTSYQSATLTWGKDSTHLVGICAPTVYSQRARIAQLSTATGVSPLVDFTANNCYIANLSIFQGVADATSLIAARVTGQRNCFRNVTFAGIGNATQVTAGAMSLKLYGAAENVFQHCTIGQDTIAIDQNCTVMNVVVNATPTASVRNTFEDCIFDAYLSNAGMATVTIGAAGIDRTLEFKNCIFMAKSTNKAITQTSLFSIPAISQGAILLFGSVAFSDGGAVDWDSNNRGIIWNSSVAAAAAAAGGIMTNQ